MSQEKSDEHSLIRNNHDDEGIEDELARIEENYLIDLVRENLQKISIERPRPMVPTPRKIVKAVQFRSNNLFEPAPFINPTLSSTSEISNKPFSPVMFFTKAQKTPSSALDFQTRDKRVLSDLQAEEEIVADDPFENKKSRIQDDEIENQEAIQKTGW